jgi:hypothetical protein
MMDMEKILELFKKFGLEDKVIVLLFETQLKLEVTEGGGGRSRTGSACGKHDLQSKPNLVSLTSLLEIRAKSEQ